MSDDHRPCDRGHDQNRYASRFLGTNDGIDDGGSQQEERRLNAVGDPVDLDDGRQTSH